jgi:hypothetical protein
MYVCMYVCMYASMYVCMYACSVRIYQCMYVFTLCICIFTRILHVNVYECVCMFDPYVHMYVCGNGILVWQFLFIVLIHLQ